jgi:hypothetical protein
MGEAEALHASGQINNTLKGHEQAGFYHLANASIEPGHHLQCQLLWLQKAIFILSCSV